MSERMDEIVTSRRVPVYGRIPPIGPCHPTNTDYHVKRSDIEEIADCRAEAIVRRVLGERPTSSEVALIVGDVLDMVLSSYSAQFGDKPIGVERLRLTAKLWQERWKEPVSSDPADRPRDKPDPSIDQRLRDMPGLGFLNPGDISDGDCTSLCMAHQGCHDRLKRIEAAAREFGLVWGAKVAASRLIKELEAKCDHDWQGDKGGVFQSFPPRTGYYCAKCGEWKYEELEAK